MFSEKVRSDQVSRNDEEHIDTNEPAAEVLRPQVVKKNYQNGERSQRLDICSQTLWLY
jgi:hypothetical protein